MLGQAHGERRWRLWLPISLGVPCTHAYQGAESQVPAALVYRGESWPELGGLVALHPPWVLVSVLVWVLVLVLVLVWVCVLVLVFVIGVGVDIGTWGGRGQNLSI